jgi:hypothetical protein
MADKWEYRTVEAGTFKLDRLLAQGWEAYTATEQPSPDDGGPRGLGPAKPRRPSSSCAGAPAGATSAGR